MSRKEEEDSSKRRQGAGPGWSSCLGLRKKKAKLRLEGFAKAKERPRDHGHGQLSEETSLEYALWQEDSPGETEPSYTRAKRNLKEKSPPLSFHRRNRDP